MGPITSYRSRFASATLVFARALACDIDGLDTLVREAEGLIPPAYREALRRANLEPMELSSPREKADCRLGLRLGTQIASSFMRGVNPSCDRLLAPVGAEWVPPPRDEASTTFARCFDLAWSSRVSAIVLDTAQLCAWQAFASSMTAAQLEYNRCYLSVANEASFGATFFQRPFEPGAFALVPRDDVRWRTMLATIRSRYGEQTGLLSFACEIGKSDAESGISPQNLLRRKGEVG